MIPVIYFILIVAHAFIDYLEIKQGRAIRHKTEAVYYALACFVLFWVLTWLTNTMWLPALILFPLLTRAAFFDPLLNLFRGKNILYEGGKKNRDKSFFDNLEKSIGWPVWVYRIIYFVLYLTYLIIYLR